VKLHPRLLFSRRKRAVGPINSKSRKFSQPWN
jgi:hypothetical protein